jgi:dTDP-4-dehydrorhamnose 3,5-epimerase
MRLKRTPIDGVVLIEAEPHTDARGLFARLYCSQEFAAAGLGSFASTQVNLSRNTACHTLRGMHYQMTPFAEAKLVRAVCGRAWDVVIDVRHDSATYLQWTAVELDTVAMVALFVPEGCAHGFLTLEPDTDILYQMGRAHTPGHERGMRWNDPALNIAWPAVPSVIAPRDAEWPLIADRPGYQI